MTNEMRTLLEGLLQRDVDKRLGCLGRLFVYSARDRLAELNCLFV